MSPPAGGKDRPTLRGTLDLLVLRALALEPLHGVGVCRRIQQMTRGMVEVSYGSLFPALHRMETRGLLSAEWKTSDSNRRAKYYRLTRAGTRQLQAEERAWTRIVTVVNAALQSK